LHCSGSYNDGMPIDYSKFDSIVDSDDEKTEKSTKEADAKAAAKPEKLHCHNCMKDIDKPLRCGVCKKVSYCSQECQKSDWSFHKRNCKKPEAPKPKASKEEKQVKKEVKEENTKRRKEEDEKIVEEDSADMTWYRHREWKPTAEPKQEFMPAQISKEAAAVASTAGAPKAGSVWNAAGTWEDKDVTSLAISTLGEHLRRPALPDIDVAGGSISVEEVEKVEGDASKPVIRGKKRHIFDLSFKVKFAFKFMDSTGQKKASGSLSVSDFTNDAFVEDCANPPVMDLSFKDVARQGLDAFRQKAVEDAIGSQSWPAAAGTFTGALAARMKAWSDEFQELSTGESERYRGYKVGVVLTVAKVEGKDKLKELTVDIGSGEPLPVVTSAPNVEEGSRVVVATVGAEIEVVKGEKIQVMKSCIGGRPSEGMICDCQMLGWTGGAAGPAAFVPDSFAPGATPPSSRPK